MKAVEEYVTYRATQSTPPERVEILGAGKCYLHNLPDKSPETAGELTHLSINKDSSKFCTNSNCHFLKHDSFRRRF